MERDEAPWEGGLGVPGNLSDRAESQFCNTLNMNRRMGVLRNGTMLELAEKTTEETGARRGGTTLTGTRPTGATVVRLLRGILLAVAAVFLVLHAVHLKADFPNHSPWMDWSKYTDEGWYGDAAIRHYERGHWYVQGDFNPAAALPVWPLVEAAVFRFTGVGVAPARGLTVGIFGLILLCSYLLLERWHTLRGKGRAGHVTLAPALAVLMLAVSPFCYVFTRMAILEPMLVLLTLLALLAASAVEAEDRRRGKLRRYGPTVALGLLLPLMVLTKTTAVFLMPAVAWLLWARCGYKVRRFVREGAIAGGIAAAIWLGYYGLLVHKGFLLDYKYLFSANAYTGMTRANALAVVKETFVDGMWMGHLLFPLGMGALVLVLLAAKRYLKNPLVGALILWGAGYAAFLAYHANLQPRYYLVTVVPLTMLVAMVFESRWTEEWWGETERDLSTLHRLAGAAAGVALATLIALDAWETVTFVRTPEYTFLRAAEEIRRIVEADPRHNPLVLSISGSDLSLMTGVPSICDDFGTMDLAVRVATYKPGWYATWNQVDDDKMDALTPLYHLERVAAFPSMDDPDRNLLILYRLDPATPTETPKHRRRRPIPRLLRTSLGQQPSETQLEH